MVPSLSPDRQALASWNHKPTVRGRMMESGDASGGSVREAIWLR
jgi:hypothetical protein